MEALEIERPEGLRRAGREDSALLGAITADAFRDDPFNHWTFGSEAAMRHTFTGHARTGSRTAYQRRPAGADARHGSGCGAGGP